MRADIADRVTGGFSFVTPQIVQNDDSAGFQGGDQALLDPRGESGPIDGAVQHEGGDDAVAAQTS